MTKILTNHIDLIVLSLTLNFFFIIFFKKISNYYGLFDYPDYKRKIHTKPISLLGGLIIFSNFILSIVYTLIVKNYDIIDLNLFIDTIQSFIIFLFVAILIFILGILDDKFFLDPVKKFFILIFLITILCLNDSLTLVNVIKIPLNDSVVSFTQLSLIFSILCYVFLIISLNMFDGINLQSFLFYIINFGFIFINTNYFSPFLLPILISLIFFGYLNYKNQIFLGDNGTFILAFLLGYFYVKNYNMVNIYNSIDIFNFLFLPVIDTVRVIIDRQLKNKKIFLPDKIHFHHKLLQKYKYNKTILILLTIILIPHILFLANLNAFFTSSLLFFMYFYFLFKR